MEQHNTTRPVVSRRAFLGSAGMTAIALAAPASGFARALGSCQAGPMHRLLHVTAGCNAGKSILHTYALEGESGTCIGRHRAERVLAFTTHPVLPILYAASDRGEPENLPRGTISAYRVEADTGKLHQIARVFMSLSATEPRSMAVSPDGQFLLVAAFAGGAWNSFALDRDGVPAPIPQARKETGSGPDTQAQTSAHPFATVFVPYAALAIGTDRGSDRISVLRPSLEGIDVVARVDAPAGSGPSHVAIACSGQSLVVSHALKPALSVHTLCAQGKAQMETHSVLPMRSPATVLFADPHAPVFYTVQALPGNAGSIESWRLNPDGALSPIDAKKLPFGAATSVARDNGTLWAAVPQGVARLELNPDGTSPEAELHVGLPGGAHLLALQQC